MKFETLHGVTLPKIGFGTWRIAGRSAPDPSVEMRSRSALQSALDLGYTHFDTAEVYADGGSEELLGEVIRQSAVDRDKLFITTKVSPLHLKFNAVLKACENSLRRLQMEYIDLYLIHWPNPLINLAEPFCALNKLVSEGKVKHLGVSNFKLKMLMQASSLSETPLLANQVPYSLPEQTYVKNGVLDYCWENHLLFCAYSPVSFRNLRVNPVIRSIANDHGATPFQIALAWLVAQPNVITIPMSFDPVHQAENLAAADLELSQSEMELLNHLYHARNE